MATLKELRDKLNQLRTAQINLMKKSATAKDPLAVLEEVNSMAAEVAKVETEIAKLESDVVAIGRETFTDNVTKIMPGVIADIFKKLSDAGIKVPPGTTFNGVLEVTYDPRKPEVSYTAKSGGGGSGTKSEPGSKDAQRKLGMITKVYALSKTGKILEASKGADFARLMMAEKIWPGPYAEIDGKLEPTQKDGSKASVNHVKFLRDAIRSGKDVGLVQFYVTRVDAKGQKSVTKHLDGKLENSAPEKKAPSRKSK